MKDSFELVAMVFLRKLTHLRKYTTYLYKKVINIIV